MFNLATCSLVSTVRLYNGLGERWNGGTLLLLRSVQVSNPEALVYVSCFALKFDRYQPSLDEC